MRATRAVLWFPALAAALLAAPLARAQSIQPGYPTRTLPGGASDQDARPPGQDPGGGVNYADCVNDVSLNFTLTVEDPNMATDHLVVLAGPSRSACFPALGSTSTPLCWPVIKEGSVTLAPTTQVSIRARDITAYLGATSVPSTYTAQTDPTSACQSQTCPGPVALGIYFLIEGSNNEVPAAEYEQGNGPGEFYPLYAGTLGPQAPANMSAAIGTGYVTLTWTPPTESAIAGYIVYGQNFGKIDAALPDVTSAPVDASEAASGNSVDAGLLLNECPTQYFTNVYTVPACASTVTTPTGPNEDAGTTSPDSAITPFIAEAGDFTDASVIDEVGVSTGPVDTNAGISQISSQFIVASPTDSLDGAMTAGATTATATIPAKNFDFYVFAVAAVDTLGNVGAVSNLQCGTPGPIKDFWYNYSTLDGGLAGGGYCALEGVGMPAGSAFMTAGVGIAAVSLLRRRRKRRR